MIHMGRWQIPFGANIPSGPLQTDLHFCRGALDSPRHMGFGGSLGNLFFQPGPVGPSSFCPRNQVGGWEEREWAAHPLPGASRGGHGQQAGACALKGCCLSFCCVVGASQIGRPINIGRVSVENLLIYQPEGFPKCRTAPDQSKCGRPLQRPQPG